MLEYIKNIMPRIQQYSKQLDKTEIFVEKSWIYIDEQNNNHEYMFMRDKRLIMSLNGSVTTGTWELLPNGKLLINRVKDEVLLQNMFFDDALMVLQKSGSNDEPFTLINEARVPDLDALRYLQMVEERKIEYPDNEVFDGIMIYKNGRVHARNYSVGSKVINYDGRLVTGNFHIPERHKYAYMEVVNGILKSVYFLVPYKSVNRKDFSVRQHHEYLIEGGKIMDSLDELGFKINASNVIYDEKYKESFKVIINENGTVIKDKSTRLFVVKMWILLIVVIIYLTYLSLSDT